MTISIVRVLEEKDIDELCELTTFREESLPWRLWAMEVSLVQEAPALILQINRENQGS